MKERLADEIVHCFILECQIGFYRNADRISKCLPCPANSASNTGRTGCTCDKGYYSSSDEADCKGTLIVKYVSNNNRLISPNFYTVSFQSCPIEFELPIKELKALQCQTISC